MCVYHTVTPGNKVSLENDTPRRIPLFLLPQIVNNKENERIRMLPSIAGHIAGLLTGRLKVSDRVIKVKSAF